MDAVIARLDTPRWVERSFDVELVLSEIAVAQTLEVCNVIAFGVRQHVKTRLGLKAAFDQF
jgi:hypothetical protein